MYVIHDREQYKSGRTDQDAVWGMNLGGGQRTLLYGVHIGTKWRIRLNDQCAAAMRFMSKLLYYSNKTVAVTFCQARGYLPSFKALPANFISVCWTDEHAYL